jgi:pyridinium-3,5-bisthiocarboxylic acid mononucleotide nickel chelatase
MSQRIAYLDCHSGISGDMFLGAMLDAGFPLETLRQALASLPVRGYELKLASFQDKGIRGSRFEVKLAEQEQPARHFSEIVALLQAATLSPRARERAIAMFHCIAEAESVVHGSTLEEVHFHVSAPLMPSSILWERRCLWKRSALRDCTPQPCR